MAAAKRDSLTLGEWLDRAIRHQVKADRSAVPSPPLEETLARLAESIERQNARLDAVEARGMALQEERVSGTGNILKPLYGLLRGKNAA